MPLVKTSELTDMALDWAVAKCCGVTEEEQGNYRHYMQAQYSPSTTWSQGGPIIERENITLRTNASVVGHWAALIDFGSSNTAIKARMSGPTPLIAAMRCYVASKLGDKVEVPEELLT